MSRVTLTFAGGLHFILPARKRQTHIIVEVEGTPSVKHLVESIGVPHTEIGAVLVNDEPGSLTHLVRDGDRIQVLPVPNGFPGGEKSSDPEPRFVADTHLGKLATYLRMLGFDTLYDPNYADEELARISCEEERVLLTRDRGLLKRKQVTRGYCVVSLDPPQQIRDVLERFTLAERIQPFRRCLRCNALLESIPKEAAAQRVPPQSRQYYDEYHECPACRQIYWKGSHYQRMQRFIANLLPPANPRE